MASNGLTANLCKKQKEKRYVQKRTYNLWCLAENLLKLSLPKKIHFCNLFVKLFFAKQRNYRFSTLFLSICRNSKAGAGESLHIGYVSDKKK